MLENEMIELCSKSISDADKLAQLKALVEKGANVNARDKETNASALIHLSERGNLECVKFLLNRGATLIDVDNMGWNALKAAIEHNENKVAQYLAIRHAEKDIDVSDTEPEEVVKYKLLTAYFYACQHNLLVVSSNLLACLRAFDVDTSDVEGEIRALLGMNGNQLLHYAYWRPQFMKVKTEAGREEEKVQTSVELDADDSSDEEDDVPRSRDYKLPNYYESFKNDRRIPAYVKEKDPEGYSYLTHAVAIKQIYSKEVSQVYYGFKRTLPRTSLVVDETQIVAWLEKWVTHLLENVFLKIEKQKQRMSDLKTKFLSENKAWLVDKIAMLLKNNKRAIFRQIHSETICEEIGLFILDIQSRVNNFIAKLEIEDEKLEDPPYFAIDHFRNAINLYTESFLVGKGLLRNGYFVGKNQRPQNIQPGCEVDRIILEKAAQTNGTNTFSKFVAHEKPIFDMLLQTELDRAQSLIKREARGYFFVRHANAAGVQQSAPLAFLFSYNSDTLLKAYLPDNGATIKDTLWKSTKEWINPFLFMAELKRNKPTSFLKRGLLPQQYTFVSNSIVEFYANIRLAMRVQRRRVRQALDEGESKQMEEETFQVAWQFGRFPFVALEQQGLSVNGYRTDMVANAGSYKDIYDFLGRTNLVQGEFAPFVVKALFWDETVFNTRFEALKVNKKDYTVVKKFLVAFSYLLLGCEVQRNPASLVTHLMALELIEQRQLSWEEAMVKKDYEKFCAGGEMPMTMSKYEVDNRETRDRNKNKAIKSEPVKCARALQKHYGFFSVRAWTYEGELASESTGSHERAHLQELICRENHIVKKWLVFKKLNDKSPEQQITAIEGCLQTFLSPR